VFNQTATKPLAAGAKIIVRKGERFAPEFMPATGKTRTLQSILDKIAGEAEKSWATDAIAASVCRVKQNNPLTSAVNGLRGVGGRGLEPPTPSLSSWCSNQLS
jgi:hypothetical protein